MNLKGHFCTFLLTVMFGLITTINANAGVTDGGVTAYRNDFFRTNIMFTNNPSDDPSSDSGPLGAGGSVVSLGCNSNIQGTAGVAGLFCSGTPGEPISTYTCAIGNGGTYSPSHWCLFSENPRTGNKAWAIKFVDGLIPTNDGTSIVRCAGSDIFDQENGCRPPPSVISVEGGFIKLDTTEGNAPLNADCSEAEHDGRMVIDNVNKLLYICTEAGWIGK